MRLILILMVALFGLSACNPGRPSGGTGGQLSATFSNIVGTPPGGLSLTPFSANQAIATTQTFSTHIAGTQGNRVVQITIAPGLTANRSCTETSSEFGSLGCSVSIGIQGQLSSVMFSKTANLNATISGGVLTVSGTAHFENTNGTIKYDVAINSVTTPLVSTP